MIRLHHGECDCPTCERCGLGVLAYREVAEELRSDDPAVIDPVWRARCQTRIDACNDAQRREHERQASSERPVPSLLARVIEPSRRAA